MIENALRIIVCARQCHDPAKECHWPGIAILHHDLTMDRYFPTFQIKNIDRYT